MILFWVFAAALTLGVMAALAFPLLRRGPNALPGRVEQNRLNIDLYHDQLLELERDLTQGVLSREQFDEAKAELDARLLADVPGTASNIEPPRRPLRALRYAPLIAIPMAALGLYLTLGTPQATDERLHARLGETGEHGANLEHMVQRLAARLEQEPGDLEAWQLLGRSLQALGRMDDAAKVFAKAVELAPHAAPLWADYADALVSGAHGQWSAAAREALARALALDADYPKALWLAGTEAYARKDFAMALRHWQKLEGLVQDNPKVRAILQANIAEVRALAAGSAPDKSPEGSQKVRTASGPEVLTGTVQLSGAVASKVKPEDTVFVYARAAEGPKMPLAIRRIRVHDLPYKFSLDDSAAMAPGMTISAFDQVVVGARVSRSGDAAARPGDLEGSSTPVKPGTSGIEVVISAEVR